MQSTCQKPAVKNIIFILNNIKLLQLTIKTFNILKLLTIRYPNGNQSFQMETIAVNPYQQHIYSSFQMETRFPNGYIKPLYPLYTHF